MINKIKNSNFFKQISKFGLVDGIAYIIDYCFLIICKNFFGINIFISTAIAFTISVVFNYVLSVVWIFSVDKSNSKARNFIFFMIFSIFGLLLTEIIMYIGVKVFVINYLLVKIIAIGIIMFFNFMISKLFLESDHKRLFVSKKTVMIHNVLVSVLFVICVSKYLFPHELFGRNTIFNLLLLYFVLRLVVFNSKYKLKDKKYPIIFSFIFSFSLLIGRGIYNTNNVFLMFNSYKKIVLFVLNLYSFTIVFSEVVFDLFKCFENLNMGKKLLKPFNKKHIFLLLWFMIFASWIPVFLAYYPGILSYDSKSQTMQAFLGFSSYTKFHPPLHTFVWTVCLKLGSIMSINAMVIYSVVQMLFLSYTFAKLIKYMIDRKVSNAIVVFSLLFFMLNPVISIFSMVMTKDVYFCGFVVLFIIELLKLCSNPKQYLSSYKSIFCFVFCALFSSLFRNNFIYVFIVIMPVLLIIYREYLKKIVIVLGFVMITYHLVNNTLYGFLKIGEGNPREMLCVPMQQIACVVNWNDKELDSATKEKVSKFIDYKTALNGYNPRFADPVKRTFNSEYFSDNKTEFIKLWLDLLSKYPNEYASSFLTLNLPYWYFDAASIDRFAKRIYIESSNTSNDYYSINRRSKMPYLLVIYEQVASYELFEGIPLVSNMTSLSMPFWLLLLSLFNSLYRKKYKTIPVIVTLILLIMTYIVGPVSNFRYIFPIVAMYPLIIAIMLNTKKFE